MRLLKEVREEALGRLKEAYDIELPTYLTEHVEYWQGRLDCVDEIIEAIENEKS